LPARDNALADLARRYFTSHGPAQLKDFVWWSGLMTGEARAGLEMSRHHLTEEEIGGVRYWLAPSRRTLGQPRRTAYLLPPYDEFLIAYKDRSASLDPALWEPGAGPDSYAAPVVLDGRVVGRWRRGLKGDRVAITLDLPRHLASADARLVEEAAGRYGNFLGADVVMR
jgi:Winged helix DNA-binding domain